MSQDTLLSQEKSSQERHQELCVAVQASFPNRLAQLLHGATVPTYSHNGKKIADRCAAHAEQVASLSVRAREGVELVQHALNTAGQSGEVSELYAAIEGCKIDKVDLSQNLVAIWTEALSLTSEDVLERLSDLFVRRGVPSYLRSDNGAEFTATKVRKWLGRVGVTTLFIEPGSPWENGYVESFNGKLRDELLAREQFDTLLEAKVLIERWRRNYNTRRPHSSLGYRVPAPEAFQPASFASATPQQTKQAGVGADPTIT